jgi:phosphate starvation-inducible protein PhoH and related proteins
LARSNQPTGDQQVSKRIRRARRAQYLTEPQHQVIDFTQFKRRENRVKILPKNLSQEYYLDLLDDSQKDIVFATGPAGTGKTMMAVLAAIRALKAGEIQKIVITRPAVSVDEQHGFLPGTLVEKMAPWTRPIFDIIEEYYSPKEIETMIAENVIEVAPLAYMRGRNFSNCFILADEMQNATVEQIKMLLTRIASGSKMVVTGDPKQHDRGYEQNGLSDFLTRLERTEGSSRIGSIVFTTSDVQRHPIVEEILNIYDQE